MGASRATIEGAVKPSVSKAIHGVVTKRLGRFGLRDVEIRPGVDHDGDPVLYVTVHYAPRGRPLPKGTTFWLLSEVRDVLLKLGESRFPHVRHEFPERQRAAG